MKRLITVSEKHDLKIGVAEAVVLAGGVGAAAWVGWSLGQGGVGWGYIAAWCAGLVAAGLSFRWPVVGFCAYVGLVYGTPRYDGSLVVIAQMGASSYLCGVCVAGWGVWWFRQSSRPRVWGATTVAMAAFVVWLGVCLVAALAQGRAWNPHFNHHPRLYVEALGMMLVAATAVSNAKAVGWFALVLSVALCVRGVVTGTEGLYLDGDAGALVVMCLPLTLMGWRTCGDWRVGAVWAALGMGLVVMLALTQNRAGAVGFVALVLCVLAVERFRWPVYAVSAGVLAVLGVAFYFSPYWQRFVGIWEGTTDRNSVEARLQMWGASWRMYLDHPVFGVGPGNFPNLIQGYVPRLDDRYATHNNFLSVLAEAGPVGLVLYGGLFLGALVGQWRTWRVAGPDWPGAGARAVFAAVVVYLVVGQFISRQDMPLAYILVGLGVGMRRRVFG